MRKLIKMMIFVKCIYNADFQNYFMERKMGVGYALRGRTYHVLF